MLEPTNINPTVIYLPTYEKFESSHIQISYMYIYTEVVV
jgi:hypothetical protein